MFGYATDETEECMPLTIVLAHKLNAKMAELRRNGTIPWLRPDSKTQVSMCVFVGGGGHRRSITDQGRDHFSFWRLHLHV